MVGPTEVPDFGSRISRGKDENSCFCKLWGGSSVRLGNMANEYIEKAYGVL